MMLPSIPQYLAIRRSSNCPSLTPSLNETFSANKSFWEEAEMKKMISRALAVVALCGATFMGASSAYACADFSDVIVCVRSTAEFADGSVLSCSNG